MHQVSARNLPGSDASRKFEGGKHAPPGVLFVLEHNNQEDGPRLHRHRCDETFLVTEAASWSGPATGRSKADRETSRSLRLASRPVSPTWAPARPG
jgi:hypothetical protein